MRLISAGKQPLQLLNQHAPNWPDERGEKASYTRTEGPISLSYAALQLEGTPRPGGRATTRPFGRCMCGNKEPLRGEEHKEEEEEVEIRLQITNSDSSCALDSSSMTNIGIR